MGESKVLITSRMNLWDPIQYASLIVFKHPTIGELVAHYLAHQRAENLPLKLHTLHWVWKTEEGSRIHINLYVVLTRTHEPHCVYKGYISDASNHCLLRETP